MPQMLKFKFHEFTFTLTLQNDKYLLTMRSGNRCWMSHIGFDNALMVYADIVGDGPYGWSALYCTALVGDAPLVCLN